MYDPLFAFVDVAVCVPYLAYKLHVKSILTKLNLTFTFI
jgi:hypothetical protein